MNKKPVVIQTPPTPRTRRRRRQQRISAYFKTNANVEKEVPCTSENNVANNCTYKKRKAETESMESSAMQYETTKSNGTDDVYIVECVQRRRIPIVTIDSDTDISNSNYKIASTSVKKNITECAFKENISVDKSKNVLNNLNETITKVQNSKSPSRNVLHEKFTIEECKPNFKGKLNVLNDSPVIEIDSDTESLGCSTILKDEWFDDDQLNFNTLQRCKVVDMCHERDALVLSVTNSEFQTPIVIECLEYWKYTKVEKDSIIAVEARKEKTWWKVDNEFGFIVAYPDILISSTTIVGGIFCKRKSILNEKFRKIESLPCFKTDQTAMVIGSFVHELLQKVIQKDINKFADIKKLLDSMLQSRDTIRLLYATGITLDACRKQMLVFVPRIYQFIQHYLKDKRQEEINRVENNFKGQIVDILDIEENVWLPCLGIKGKIDVTVEVEENYKRKMMPLEIKTGKPSFSLEHKGQIILYIMMMALTGQDTDTGLLLYLRENNIQEIKSDHRERRDLMQLRNVLAYYLTPKSTEMLSESTADLNWAGFELPEPINHPSACNNCVYNSLCCAYLSKDSNNKLPLNHPLNQLKEKISRVLSPSHTNYVLHWILLLEMEENAQTTDKSHSNLWTLNAEQRENKKICISNLKMLKTIKESSCKYKFTFIRNNSNAQDRESIPYTEFSENEYVLISTDKRINVSAGFIVHLSNTSVAVRVDRDISKYITNELVHIDKYQSSTLHCSNLASVGGLLANNDICAKLREIVIDRKPATFDQGVPQSIVSKSSKILQTLNENQQRVVLKALTASDYILIKGMPGTGKTQTLIAFIELLHETGRSVLITSHTNNAVDNILLKLLAKGIDFLRLGSSVHESLKAYAEKNAIASCTTPEEMEIAYSKSIVGVTCYGAYHPMLCTRIFDVCVVDESAQILQPTVLRPLYNARKFVLVGDPDQLPPIIQSSQARQRGADESLFSRLDSENNTVILTEQYRMNRYIMTLANKLTYNDKLKAGNMLIDSATFNANHNKILVKVEPWIQRALSQNLSDSVMLLNTGPIDKLKVNYKFCNKYPESDQVCSNIFEAAVLRKLVQTLLQMHVKPENIGIIAPYRAHVNLLKNVIQNGIEINTVDQYQGRDKQIILYSCAKSLINSNNVKQIQDLEVLGDHRRLTVAITRAKCKLIIVGDKSTLLRYTIFQKLFSLIEDKNTIHLHDNSDGFSWKQITSAL